MEKVLHELDELKKKLEHRILGFEGQLAATMNSLGSEYVSRRELPQLIADRVTRDELLTMIPDQESILEQIKDYCHAAISECEDKLHATLKSFDNRLVLFRKECDFESLKSMIRAKAD